MRCCLSVSSWCASLLRSSKCVHNGTNQERSSAAHELDRERGCNLVQATNAGEISDLSKRIISEYKHLDHAYDRATDHGVTQGAKLF